MTNSRCLRFALLRRIALLLLTGGLLTPWPALAATPPQAATVDSTKFIELTRQSAGGDLDQIRKRTFLRVLVVPNKTHFMVDRGRQYGIAYELLRDFEKTLNRDFPKKQKKYLSVVFIPVHRNEIFQRLKEGRGDLAVANLTDTPERRLLADFSSPFVEDVREIVVSGPASAPLKSLDDLAGKPLFVRKSSSFYLHLKKLNEDFATRKLAPIRIQEAAEHLEAEDMLEMLNAGLIQYTVVDQPIGEFWIKVFPKLVLHPELSIAGGQNIAWAIRQGTPKLKVEVDRFVARNRAGTATGNTLLRRYLKDTRWAKGATSQKELERFSRTVAYFRKYAGRYDFDPLMLAAQGYQESGLDQSRKSHVGAVGVMQLMPATGKEMRVGDIHQEEANIHAGTKYMRQLVDVYFDDPAIDPMNRTLFAFAGYNAGPGRVAGLRKTAAKHGFDPNVWFGNVEVIASMKIGRETTQYVANISKYYIAYKLIAEQGSDGLTSEAK